MASIIGEWDLYTNGKLSAQTIKVEKLPNGDHRVSHPLVMSGQFKICKDLVGVDGASLSYEGYRGRLEGDHVVWDRNLEWRRRPQLTGQLEVSKPKLLAEKLLVSKTDIQGAGLQVLVFAHGGGVSETHRAEVRERTKSKVQSELRLAQWGAPVDPQVALPHVEELALFADASRNVPGRGTKLGRFDVIAVPGRADIDSAWRFRHHERGLTKPLIVLHAAALNVGESTTTATDWQDYSVNGRLDDARYVDDMGRIFDNILRAAELLQIRHLVWFPFGMGAFLRHLGLHDARYAGRDIAKNQAHIELRRALCQRFARSLPSRKFKVYVALGPSGHGDESDVNADAFVRALAETNSQLGRDAVQVCLHADALELADDLAAQQRGSVAMVNGTNRQLIGNHWFEDGARRAIDENLHRRSWWLATYAYVLNTGLGNTSAPPDASTMASLVTQLGGKAYNIS